MPKVIWLGKSKLALKPRFPISKSYFLSILFIWPVLVQLPVCAKYFLLNAGGVGMRKSLTQSLQSKSFQDVVVPSSVMEQVEGREGDLPPARM